MNKFIDKKWNEWFIGFSDAEANFQTFPKKRIGKDGKTIKYYNIGYGYHLRLNIIDKEIIKNIHLKLNNIGNIYEYSNNNRQEIHLAITKLEDLKWLIYNIFNDYTLLTKHQNERFSRLKYGVENKIN